MDMPCKERVTAACKERLDDLRTLLDAPEQRTEKHGDLETYALAYDYVPPGTFRDQKRGYVRYLISCDGPSEEIRYYLDERRQVIRAEFWLLDWHDEARRTLKGPQLQTTLDLYDWLGGAEWSDDLVQQAVPS